MAVVKLTKADLKKITLFSGHGARPAASAKPEDLHGCVMDERHAA